jgi:hypothetical protein
VVEEGHEDSPAVAKDMVDLAVLAVVDTGALRSPALHHGSLRGHCLCARLIHLRRRRRHGRGHGLGPTGGRGSAEYVGEGSISLVIRGMPKPIGTRPIRSALLIVCHSVCQL